MRTPYGVIAAIFILLLTSCAIRDNEHDPLSPLHKSPELSVVLNFDSTRATPTLTDAYTAVAPFQITFDADANDYFDAGQKTAITFRYYFNGELQKESVNFSNDSLILRSAGHYNFSFSSSAENGAATNREIIVDVTSPVKPSIVDFRIAYDTIPLYSKIPVAFFCDYTDESQVADSIVYAISAINQPVHKLAHLCTMPVCHDTLILGALYSDSEYTQTITAYLFDELGGLDSHAITVTFSKDKQIIRGTAPIIDSIFIVEAVTTIYEDHSLPFSFSVSDDVMKRLRSFSWDFGDNEISKAKYPFHAFKTPGIYTVTLTVTDDSLNTASASMIVTVNKKQIIKPVFTSFIVENDSGPAPLTISVTATADDEDGVVRFMGMILNDEHLDPVWPPIRNEEITIQQPGTYYLMVWARDNDDNFNFIKDTIIVTPPLK